MASVRPARSGDIPALTDLLGELYTLEPQFRPDPEKQRAGLEMCLDRPELCRILVAQLEGAIIGMVNLQFCVSTALGSMSIHIDDFIVTENHRRDGVGRALMDEARRVAEEIGARRVTVNVDVANDPALSFYRGMGFSSMNLMRFKRSFFL